MNDESRIETLSALGQLAMRDAGAAGYGFYRLESGTGALVRLQICGARMAELEVPLASAVSFPLRVPGIETHVLTFVFRSPAISLAAVKSLEQMANVVRACWLCLSCRADMRHWPNTRQSWRRNWLTRKFGTGRADWSRAHSTWRAPLRIFNQAHDACVVRWLLESHKPGGSPSENFVKFTEAILRPRETAIVLEQLAAQREQEVHERNLAAQAKAVLESVYGMSEEQAHHHLWLASWKSRRPLKDVALEFIGKRS